jgi:DNA-binding NtrC family response regulator
MEKRRVLVANSDRLARKSLYEMLCRNDYEVDIAASVKEAMDCLEENSYQVILTDIDKKGDSELLKIVKEKACPSRIIVLTSYGNIEAAVNSMQMGAFDYLVRPAEDKKIISSIERALSNQFLPAAVKPVPIKKLSSKKDTFNGLVGTSRPMQDIYNILERISNSKATVLLRGESGTGKRLIAYALHKADKKRHDKPFIEMSCGALPREIIESELFGHTKGAFTGAINDRKGRFELANGGTILLDDIDSLSPDLQVKLLRILQHKEFERVGDNKTVKVDVRIIVSTNQDLEKAVESKKFREDLYYRLNVISIHIPPLRERKEDLPLLIEHFINIYSKENNKKIKSVSEDILPILTSYNWPGNIRELENIIERAVILDIDSMITKEDLPEIILSESTYLNIGIGKVMEAFTSLKDEAVTSLKHALQEPEKVHILRVLKEVDWNKKKAAKRLGVNRTTLYNKLRKYNIEVEK